MTDNEISSAFQTLWSDIPAVDNFPHKRPLLAHYTSIATLESIMRNGEFWFSHPLRMNDSEELKFGILQGARAFRESVEIRRACQTPDYYKALCEAFDVAFDRYNAEHAFDTYIFSLSEHKPENKDGLLSMWRGYGGNGNGAAIVLDSRKIEYLPGTVPVIISQVTYASTAERKAWVDRKMSEFAALIGKHAVPQEKLYIPIHELFERIKMFALFSKHDGFSEEAEWRITPQIDGLYLSSPSTCRKSKRWPGGTDWVIVGDSGPDRNLFCTKQNLYDARTRAFIGNPPDFHRT